MAHIRPYLDELARALLVLALILLNLAHAPTPAVAYDGFAYISEAGVYCSEGGPEDHSAHAPCHACRIGSDAVLTAPPSNAARLHFEAVPVIYGNTVYPPHSGVFSTANRSRGPPLLA
jgi:hypothetical protein